MPIILQGRKPHAKGGGRIVHRDTSVSATGRVAGVALAGDQRSEQNPGGHNLRIETLR